MLQSGCLYSQNRCIIIDQWPWNTSVINIIHSNNCYVLLNILKCFMFSNLGCANSLLGWKCSLKKIMYVRISLPQSFRKYTSKFVRLMIALIQVACIMPPIDNWGLPLPRNEGPRPLRGGMTPFVIQAPRPSTGQRQTQCWEGAFTKDPSTNKKFIPKLTLLEEISVLFLIYFVFWKCFRYFSFLFLPRTW